MGYGYSVTVELPFEAAVQATRDALAAQGFGVLSEININAAFANKLGDHAAAELGDYLILGACSPQLAQRALRADPDLGLLLPCNVVVRRAPGTQAAVVQAIDPQVMVRLSPAPEVGEVATEADARLRAALDAVATGARR